MTSAVSFLGVWGSYAPVPGLGNLNSGLYRDFTKGSLSGGTGPAFSLTRATATTGRDSSDLVTTIASGQPRWWRIGAASGAIGLWVNEAATNIVLQSEDHGTTWAAIAATSPTRVAANDTCGVVVLDLLGDDSGVLPEGYTQNITFTGNAVKSVSVFMKAGTSTSSVIRIRDNTALAERLVVNVAWSGGVPTPTAVTGTLEGTGVEAWGNGVYRITLVTSSITAANTNTLEFYPATTNAFGGAATGTVNVGGWMVRNAAISAPYIKTTTGSVTVNADVLTASGTGVINATEGTLYAKVIGPVDGATGNHVFFELDDGTANEQMYLQQVSNSTQGQVTDGGASQATPNTTVNISVGAAGKVAMRYRLNDTRAATNGTSSTTDTSCTMPTTTTFRLGFLTATVAQPNTVIQEVAYSQVGASDTNLAMATA